MQKSKIIQVLQTFSAKEIRLFSEFVSSPFHNKNKNIIAFTLHLAKFYPKFKNVGLEKQIVYKSVFKNEKLNEQRLRDLSSMALALTEEFLALQNFSNRKMLKTNFLLDELNKRQIDTLFEMRMKLAKKELDLTEFRENFYHEEYLTLNNELNFKNRIHFGDDKALEKFFSGRDKIKALTSYYLFEALVSYTFWVSAGQKFNQKTSFADIENVFHQLKEKLVGENIIIE
jgi:ribosome-binding ATPase YchF (GTP1/OBG family)